MAIISINPFNNEEAAKSDPCMPYVSQINSGFGRELSKDGMMELINRKTVYVG